METTGLLNLTLTLCRLKMVGLSACAVKCSDYLIISCQNDTYLLSFDCNLLLIIISWWCLRENAHCSDPLTRHLLLVPGRCLYFLLMQAECGLWTWHLTIIAQQNQPSAHAKLAARGLQHVIYNVDIPLWLFQQHLQQRRALYPSRDAQRAGWWD
jgi:hypothetical protein